jgi:hypothetical protein
MTGCTVTSFATWSIMKASSIKEFWTMSCREYVFQIFFLLPQGSDFTDIKCMCVCVCFHLFQFQFEKRMGMNKCTNPITTPLTLPNAHDYGVHVHGERGTVKASATEVAAKFLQGVIQKSVPFLSNDWTIESVSRVWNSQERLHLYVVLLFRNWNKIRIFSPDELTSNRLDKVLEVTKRNYQWVQNTANQDGRVLEVLSEHLCQGYSLSLSRLLSLDDTSTHTLMTVGFQLDARLYSDWKNWNTPNSWSIFGNCQYVLFLQLYYEIRIFSKDVFGVDLLITLCVSISIDDGPLCQVY